ncbi:MAG: phospho-sugar mutase [Clostridia bacterium]
MKNYLEEYQNWLESPDFDEETKNELKAIKDDEKEIEDRFYKELEFGTAGLRGVIGAGTNRMNKYTVGKATQGLANYILKQGTQDKGVAISYDSRKMSKEFSLQTALILNANGIKTYLFENLRPVPELSFTVRELKCTAGVMITASHNPPKYNGYKVYWDDGAQIVAPKDKDIISEVRAVKEYSEIKEISKEEAIQKGLFNVIGKEMDDKYINKLKSLILNPEIVKEQGKNLKVVYTPLHGTGNTVAERLLKEIGIENLYVVPEQKEPDGNFPTVDYPNPEDPKAFKLALELAKKVDADVVLATDPDADRLGIFAKDAKTGEYMTYTGNMSALLIAEYRISQMKEKGNLPEKGMFVTTIVSSDLAKAIAANYSLECFEVLTGFKNIGAVMKREEEKADGDKYVFGFEESYGCLIGDYARDKDGIAAVMALCEAACYYRSKGETLWDQMNNIYEKYGYYKEAQVSIVLEGAKGAEKIQEMMTNMRNTPIDKIGKYKVLEFKDIDRDYVKDMVTGKESKSGLPKSNVLYYGLEDNSWCCVRPSGTEPKIKLYMGIKGKSAEDATVKLEELKKAMVEIVK